MVENVWLGLTGALAGLLAIVLAGLVYRLAPRRTAIRLLSVFLLLEGLQSAVNTSGYFSTLGSRWDAGSASA